MLGRVGAWWGVIGVSLLIGWAVVRLSPIAAEAWAMSWGWMEWALAVPWLLFMLVGEGYRGFQKGFAPRVAARARYLREHPTTLRVALAPAFCMGFFDATRKRMIVSWAVTTGIVLLILGVRLLPQPWRGIVDLGVVAGLSWGLVAIVVYGVYALTAQSFDHPTDTPGTEPVE
ncbi:MAG TPA: hypothetical protein ENO09_09705 [bacterium]|nr:hypothetical protein [bacterium]